ncbi:MAG: PEP-CTERM sorting domain-containing protein [Pseudomonadota bacterium]
MFIRYRDGETVRTPGKLIKPGEPDPAPPGAQKGVMDGPRVDQAPALALKQVTLLLAQPELADLFPTPIDLSYFKYDFFGSDPFPAFRGSITFTTDAGLSSTLAVIPEPGTLALAAAAALAWLLALRVRPGKG